MHMLWSQDGHMKVALERSAIGSKYSLIVVWQVGLIDSGTPKSDLESQGNIHVCTCCNVPVRSYKVRNFY